MTLENLIKEGLEIALNTHSDMLRNLYINDSKRFAEWSSISLMFLQENYPKHPQIDRFEFYVKKQMVRNRHVTP